MPTVHVITRAGEVMGGWASKKEAYDLASCDPSLKVSEIDVQGVLYWMSLPAAQRLAPKGAITEADSQQIRRDITGSDIPQMLADIVGAIGRKNLEGIRRSYRRPRLKALPGGGGGGRDEREPAPVRVRAPGNVSSLRQHAARSAGRRGRPAESYLPQGPA
jgi:hypothetical protein